MTPREGAIKKIVDAGGRWPPRMARTRWSGTGRFAPVKCAECGQVQRPMAATCSLCGERLHEGS